MLRCEAPHGHLPPRPRLEQPLLQETAERLPHGRSRDADPVRELRLTEHTAGGQVAVEDRVPHLLVRAALNVPTRREVVVD